MRVLYICHRIPFPPNKGDKIRAFHELRAISARHEVDLFTLLDAAADASHCASLRPYCRQITVARLAPLLRRARSLTALLTGAPVTLPYFYSARLAREVRRAVASRSYDRIFVYCSSMAQFVEEAAGIPVLMDLVDVDSNKWFQYSEHTGFPLRAVYRREGKRLQEYERAVSSRASCAIVSTEREARVLLSFCPGASVAVVPNGVDGSYFDPPATAPAAASQTIVFTGEMNYFPNVEAVRFFAFKVLPVVRRSLPEARFLIVGRNPARRVLELAKLPGVEVTGFVPDVRPYLARAQVAVAPLVVATGVQNKILEAMAMALPVVATPLPAQGVPRSLAELIERTSDPAEMAEMIVRLLRDPERGRSLGLEGRRRVLAECNWEHSLNLLMGLLERPDDIRMVQLEAVHPGQQVAAQIA